MDQPLISLSNVSVQQKEFLILSRINLNLNKGDFVYLIGRTGSGKSSLLKLLYADIPHTHGGAYILDYDLSELKVEDIPYLRRQIGIVFQDFQLLADRSIFKNLEFVLKSTGWKDKTAINKRIEEVLEMVNMQQRNTKMPHELSGGEQQRVAIARALLNKPKLILADEPTGNLDPITSKEIMTLLTRVAKEANCAVLMATHDFYLIKNFEYPILKCEKGQITSVKLENLDF